MPAVPGVSWDPGRERPVFVPGAAGLAWWSLDSAFPPGQVALEEPAQVSGQLGDGLCAGSLGAWPVSSCL